MKIHGMCNAGPLILGLIVAALPACQKSADSVRVGGSTFPAPPAEGTASIFGTVFDLRTATAAVGAELSFEGGRTTQSDAQGQFEIGGITVGASGDLRARAADGREATVHVLPLGHERREIVLNLGTN